MKELTDRKLMERSERHRKARIARQVGKPMMVTGEEMEKALQHVQDLSKRGMSANGMSQRSGVNETTIRRYIKGGSGANSMRRSSYDAIMALDFDREGQLGPRIPPLGARRRIQALVAKGFPQRFLGEQLNMSNRYVCRVALGEDAAEYIMFKTNERFEELYEKFKDKNPKDVGLTTFQIGRAYGTARRYQWAPPVCWDDDTIDDPDAVPEWTGECGTVAGYRIHVREEHAFISQKTGKIVNACEACAMARYREKAKVK